MIRAFQWDLARQVERLDHLLAQLPLYSSLGYNQLYLHLEDAVEYPRVPGVARGDAYAFKDLEKLVQAAGRAGIGVVPIVNLLGHTQYLIKVPRLRDLNELRHADGTPQEQGQICPCHPRTLEIAERLLRDVAPLCTTGRVHVGLDESFHLGRHPLSRAEIAQIGLAGHFARYVNRLQDVARGLDLSLGIWADMLALLPEAIPLLQPGLAAYDWYYYPFARRPRMELYNFAEYDLAPPLARQGIAYWGCPMNGGFRHEPLPLFGDRLGNLRSWWQRCTETAAEGFLVTSWESSRLAFPLTTVVDAAAACLWLNPEIDDHTEMLTKGFERVFGRNGARAAARMALGCDAFPHAGYARWELQDRWDVRAGANQRSALTREARFFARMAQRSLPAPFAASVEFRHYLAERELFVNRSSEGVFKIRRLLRRGRNPAVSIRDLDQLAREFGRRLRAARIAARRMWRLTRRATETGPNEQAVLADAARLRDWRRWLAACSRNPTLAAGSTPLCGAWQLQLVVHNPEPALQKVLVEQQQPDGAWRELHSRFTIEFQAMAARPRTRLRRHLSVPVEDPALPLRIVIRGLGRVALSEARLTDGVTMRTWTEGRGRVILGRPAPKEGFPAIDWAHNADERPLAFTGLSSPESLRLQKSTVALKRT